MATLLEGFGALWVINADGSSKIQLTEDEDSFYPLWSPNGDKILFLKGEIYPKELYSKIWIMDADGGNKMMLTEHYARFPSWNPDGKKVVYSVEVSGEIGYNSHIWVVDVDEAIGTIDYGHRL